MTNLTFIGLGNIGRGMATNLAKNGKLTTPLTLFNRTTSRAEALSEKINAETSNASATTVATDIKTAISKADIVFICLGDDQAVLSTVEAILDSGVDVKGKLFVDCSTIHPDNTTKTNDRFTTAGALFVAMPVFGAPAMADAGQLICVPAGPEEATALLKPYLVGVVGKALIDFSGQVPSQATTLKILGNTFVFSMVTTLAEGHVAAEKTGLGVENLHKFISMMFPGPFSAYSTRMISGDYYSRESPLFQVDLARKDTSHAMDLAKRSGARFGVTELADGYLETVQQEQAEKGDIAGIYGAVRVKNGLPFGNGEESQK